MEDHTALRTLVLNSSAILLAAIFATAPGHAEAPSTLLQVRAVVPRATQPIQIDGKLKEYDASFAAPLEYFHPDLKNRPGQFFFLWDEQAFYVGLRTLDEYRYSQEHPLWEGDAVEWYFDTRRDKTFLNRKWGKGSVHCFYTPMHLDQVKPRFCLRPGYEEAIKAVGIEVAAQSTGSGLEVEFKLPWENFPNFKARQGEVIGIDAELSYSDGGPRSDRSFLFGSPLSVQQPANLARVKLVDRFERQHWQLCGPVMMPIRVDVPWSQETRPRVQAMLAMPPLRAHEIGKVVFQILDLQGTVIGEHLAEEQETFDSSGDFSRRVAAWPTSDAIPGQHLVRAVVYDTHDKELTRISPRMVSVNMQQGY